MNNRIQPVPRTPKPINHPPRKPPQPKPPKKGGFRPGCDLPAFLETAEDRQRYENKNMALHLRDYLENEFSKNTDQIVGNATALKIDDLHFSFEIKIGSRTYKIEVS